MKFLSVLSKALAAVPTVVVGVEAVAGEKDSATKKKLAMDALSIATQAGETVAPEQQAAIDAANQLISHAIDGAVAVANASGGFNKATAAVAVAEGIAGGTTKPATAADTGATGGTS